MCGTGTPRHWPVHTTRTHAGRAAHAGGVRCCAAALGALSRGVAGQREVVRALLEADDAVDDVRGVREDGRRHDPLEVVHEEGGGVEARVARAVAPALPVLRPSGEKAEATGAAAPNATERLYYRGTWLRLCTHVMCATGLGCLGSLVFNITPRLG